MQVQQTDVFLVISPDLRSVLHLLMVRFSVVIIRVRCYCDIAQHTARLLAISCHSDAFLPLSMSEQLAVLIYSLCLVFHSVASLSFLLEAQNIAKQAIKKKLGNLVLDLHQAESCRQQLAGAR